MLKFSACSENCKKHVEISVCSENCKKACWKFQNSSSEVVRSRCTSILEYSARLKFSGIFMKYCMRARHLLRYSLKDTLLWQMFRIFNFVKFLKQVYTRMHIQMHWVWNINVNRDQTFTHSPETLKREHSGFFKYRFCTRKRSETYTITSYILLILSSVLVCSENSVVLYNFEYILWFTSEASPFVYLRKTLIFVQMKFKVWSVKSFDNFIHFQWDKTFLLEARDHDTKLGRLEIVTKVNCFVLRNVTHQFFSF